MPRLHPGRRRPRTRSPHVCQQPGAAAAQVSVRTEGVGVASAVHTRMQLSLPAAFLLDEWDSDLAGLPSLSLMRDASRLCSQVRVHVELVARPAARVLVLAHAVARPLALGVHVHIRSHACALAHWAGAPHALRRGVRGRSVARVVPWCH